ncbi:MAG TPA: substrate-binding domain-containing protein, partial [Acidimicrobiia bacterium]|nr:substrate-binding domain-containing protein [Acidimicrobiia bacterium]
MNRWFKYLAVLAVMGMLLAACGGESGDTTEAGGATTTEGGTATTMASETTMAEGGTYTIGYSNGGGVGNGFREEQVCTAQAEALASGQVSELITIHRNTDAAGQLSDVRDLIAAGVDAIVFNPNDPDALNPALEEAAAAGIPTVSVDAYVTHDGTYNLYNNQIEYARLGAEWLFEQLGGEG